MLLFDILWTKTPPPQPDGFFDKTCRVCYLGETWFVVFYATMCILILLIDVIQGLRDETMITGDIWRTRVQSGGERYVSEEIEKRTKLAVTLVCLDNALLMLIGVFTNSYVLLIPWIAVQTMVILIEIFLLIARIFVDQTTPSKKELAFLLIMLYSYVRVWCYYRGLRLAAGSSTPCSP